MALQDTEKEKLIALGYVGAVPDMERKFYLDRGGVNVSFNDVMMSFLAAAGFSTGTLQDRWMAYLRSQGFTGTVNDMKVPFWLNFSEGGSFRLLTEAGDNIQLENGTDFLRT